MTPRPTPESRTDRAMRYTVAAFCAITFAILAPGIARSSESRAIVHKTDLHVRAAQSCERSLDRDRSPHATRRLYSRTNSMPFRHWAYRLWRGRVVHCRAKTAYLNAVPPRAIVYVFSRIGEVATAITVAGREAGRGDIWRYPYCTRVDNGVGFLGCFQMGDWARDTYGHGPTALDQAWAALRYVVDAHGWCSGWKATAPGC